MASSKEMNYEEGEIIEEKTSKTKIKHKKGNDYRIHAEPLKKGNDYRVVAEPLKSKKRRRENEEDSDFYDKVKIQGKESLTLDDHEKSRQSSKKTKKKTNHDAVVDDQLSYNHNIEKKPDRLRSKSRKREKEKTREKDKKKNTKIKDSRSRGHNDIQVTSSSRHKKIEADGQTDKRKKDRHHTSKDDKHGSTYRREIDQKQHNRESYRKQDERRSGKKHSELERRYNAKEDNPHRYQHENNDRETRERQSSYRNRHRDRDNRRDESSSRSRKHSRRKERKEKKTSSRRKHDLDGTSSPEEERTEELLSMMLEDEDEKEQRLIEERRKKREAILAKHAQQALNGATAEDTVDNGGTNSSNSSNSSSSDDDTDAPAKIEMVEKDSEAGGSPNGQLEQPTEDVTSGKGSPAAVDSTAAAAARKKSMDTFDMFSTSPGHVAHKMKRAQRRALVEEEGDHLQENWDDGEGYYMARIGEVLADRFLVQGDLGKGVFSTVVKAKCQQTEQVVAIKMIRNNDTMRKAALKEIGLLEELTARDPENRKHCVRLLLTTEYRQHTCLVFESMSMNLRETLKKFGRKVGINVKGVRVYGKQLFTALRHLASLQIVHADIKPDNILVNANHSVIKLCDFGSAFKEYDPENDPTPYLVSRFYRAPEIILGLPYDRNIDTWSVCCCLYELFTGHVMFSGKNNNEMLKIMQEIKGPFSKKLLKRHIASYDELMLDPHFEEESYRFKHQEADPVSGRPLCKLLDFTAPTTDLKQVFLSAKAGSDDKRTVLELVDLIEKGLALDPAQRLNVREATHHPFLRHHQKRK